MQQNDIIEAQLKALAIFDANNTCMSVNECAKFLNKHRNTITNLIKKRVIKAKLIENTWSIPKLQFTKQLVDNI